MLFDLVLGPIYKRINIMLLKKAVVKFNKKLTDIKLNGKKEIVEYYHLLFEIKGLVESLDFYCWVINHEISGLSNLIDINNTEIFNQNLKVLESSKNFLIEYLNKYVVEKEKFV